MSGHLELCGVTVEFASGGRTLTAVDSVDLDVPAGQVVGLVGESGCGKSTLARAIVGLTPMSAGRALLDGADVGAKRGLLRRSRGPRPVQLIFQDAQAALDPRMTVGESIAEALSGAPRSTRSGRAAEVRQLLERVSLDPGHADLPPRRLSGGQRQRVTIARALASRPRVIVADEITSALDASVQGSVLNVIRDIQRELGITMLFISHNLAVVRYVADAIAVMYNGKLVEVGSTVELTSSPVHPYTRELLASVPALGDAQRGSGALDGDPVDPLPEREPREA